MRQHQVNLLPAAAQARAAKGAALGRYVVMGLIAAAVITAVCAHAKYRLSEARTRHETARGEADLVLQAERKQQELEKELSDVEKRVHRYELVAHPLDVSRIAATIVNLLPESVSLDRLDIEAGARRSVQTARSPQPDSKSKQPRPPRVLTGELSGFAATDADVTELVTVLSKRAPLSEVQMESCRNRDIRGQSAREFRISFRVDLEARYRIASDTVAQNEEEAADGR